MVKYTESYTMTDHIQSPQNRKRGRAWDLGRG